MGYPQNLRVRWIGPCDFTIFATRDILKDEIIASIPFKLVCGNQHPECVENDKLPITKEINDKLGNSPLKENILTIWMLECVLKQQGLEHKPYFEMFHEPQASLPAGFNEQQNVYLQGSNILNEIASRAKYFEYEYDQLQKQFPQYFLKRTEDGASTPEGANPIFNFNMYYGHSMMIQRRDFSPEAMTPIGHKVMVPLMDLCQHSTNANCIDKPVIVNNEAGEPGIAGI